MAKQTTSLQQFLASIVPLTLSWMMYSVLIITWCELRPIGTLTLSPATIAPVCHGNDSLQLTCTASDSVEFLGWTLMQLVNEQGMIEESSPMYIGANSLSPQPMPIVVNSTTITIRRISARGVSPLVSTLSFDSIGIGLNGTVVNCADETNSMAPASKSTTIYIININHYTPRIQIVSEEYFLNNVTVTVEWTQQVAAIYYVRVMPIAPISLTGNVTHQLTLSYNTEYNLSVVAITPCGNATSSISLHYANCEYPELLLTKVSNDSTPIIVENNEALPVERSNITFSCPPGLVLVGHKSATCMENGEWEPDPSQLMCNNSQVTCGHPLQNATSLDDILMITGYVEPAMEGATVTFECPPQYVLTGLNTTTCMGNGEWEPDPGEVECNGLNLEKTGESRSTSIQLTVAVSSTVTAFIVISLLTIFAGSICGYCFVTRRRSKLKQSPSSSQPVPLYEDVNVLPSAAVKHQEQGLEMRENVAYGTQEPMLSLTINVAYGPTSLSNIIH